MDRVVSVTDVHMATGGEETPPTRPVVTVATVDPGLRVTVAARLVQEALAAERRARPGTDEPGAGGAEEGDPRAADGAGARAGAGTGAHPAAGESSGTHPGTGIYILVEICQQH